MKFSRLKTTAMLFPFVFSICIISCKKKGLNLLLIGFLLISLSSAFAQSTNRKIYFLADTINTTPENKLLLIGPVDAFEYMFTFYCQCAYPYKNYVSFSYETTKKIPKAEMVSEKPNYPYTSFKELMDIAAKYHKNFDNSYDLYITEVLPGNKYRTNKVKFVPYSPPVQESGTIKQKR